MFDQTIAESHNLDFPRHLFVLFFFLPFDPKEDLGGHIASGSANVVLWTGIWKWIRRDSLTAFTLMHL